MSYSVLLLPNSLLLSHLICELFRLFVPGLFGTYTHISFCRNSCLDILKYLNIRGLKNLTLEKCKIFSSLFISLNINTRGLHKVYGKGN